MKEVLAGEESALSLTLSNFFMDALEDTANKMCIGLALGEKMRLITGKASIIQDTSPPAEKFLYMKGYVTITEENI